MKLKNIGIHCQMGLFVCRELKYLHANYLIRKGPFICRAALHKKKLIQVYSPIYLYELGKDANPI